MRDTLRFLKGVAIAMAVLAAMVTYASNPRYFAAFIDGGNGGVSSNEKVERSGIRIGDTIMDVRAALGKPRSEQTFDHGEATIDTNLYYGDYQLVFDKGILSAKNKY